MPRDALQNEFERSVELLQVDGLKGAAQFADGKSVTGHLTVKKEFGWLIWRFDRSAFMTYMRPLMRGSALYLSYRP